MKQLEFTELKKLPDQGILIGVDEVGRGPLAGPVVSGGCKIKYDSKADLKSVCKILSEIGVCDSKKTNQKKRVEILKQIIGPVDFKLSHESLVIKSSKISQLSFSAQRIEPVVIDQINILRASLKSMNHSANLLFENESETLVWVDGNRLFDWRENGNIKAIVKGDSKSLVIGAASIIAKYLRDEIMSHYHQDFPHYGFDRNAGYPTKEHLEAIKQHGPCVIHRLTFRGVL